MKYYLVNYIILDNKTVIEDQYVGIILYNFPNIDEFKKSIAEMKNDHTEIDNIVIKSYKQISKEAYDSLETAAV